MPRLSRLAAWRKPRSSQTSDSDPLLRHAASEDRAILERALPYSMTGIPRMLGVVDAVRYCVRRDLAGAFAECGVWRGGSVLAMILTLQQHGVIDRDIYLYDTFEGMTEPTQLDVSDLDGDALHDWRDALGKNVRPWSEVFGSQVFDEASVRSLLAETDYPSDRLHFVKGPVEQTLPGEAPDRLALLRLDTDWYESTRHELVHLFPRLLVGGVLIIDDYGHWRGARQAVDEYFSSEHSALLMCRTDYTGRMAVKL